eukprot:TRINITY_DN16905_c0_g1_i12.p1 TRINITY_DN16905_c0_g1~~TRINITY_DN16905_c0_g1_i12.p1  ORF type:complete len:118 (+),score=3.54 TRINITY_DN16905_c0_g1_i12:593-946(+)
MRMAEISNVLIEHLKGKTLEFIEANKTRLKFYGMLTVVCLALDTCLLLYNAGRSAMVGMVVCGCSVGDCRVCANGRSVEFAVDRSLLLLVAALAEVSGDSLCLRYHFQGAQRRHGTG